MDRALLRTPPVAWPTVALALLTTGSWALAVAAAWSGLWPLPLAALVAALAAYLGFTPLHDATHRAVARARWANDWVGRLAGLPLLAPFPAFQRMHLAHHKHVNEPEHDPDHWSGAGPTWLLPLRWLTQDLHYYARVIGNPRAFRAGELAEILFVVGLQVAGGVVAWRLGQGWTYLWAVLVPARLATAALAFAFDYLPHRPHVTPAREDRFAATLIFSERWLTLPLCGQNYHLVHHLYPAVPFYRYGAVWFDQREELLAAGAQERALFGGGGLVAPTSGSAPSPR